MKFIKMRMLFCPPILLQLFGCGQEPELMQITDVIENVVVQPAEALKIAAPYLEEHATYHWDPQQPLKTYIVKYRKWYYVMRTNYPAKTLRFYMQPAVRINTTDGKVTFIEKEGKPIKRNLSP